MNAEHLAVAAHAVHAAPNSSFGYQQRHGVASDEHEATKHRLRRALAREAALLRERDELIRKLSPWREIVANHLAKLTPRECQIMELVLAGQPSKNIAADLGINQRTVENHRASIMQKTASRSLPALAQLAMAAAWLDAWNPGPAMEASSPRQQPTWHGELPTSAFFGAAASTAPHGVAERSGWR